VISILVITERRGNMDKEKEEDGKQGRG